MTTADPYITRTIIVIHPTINAAVITTIVMAMVATAMITTTPAILAAQMTEATD